MVVGQLEENKMNEPRRVPQEVAELRQKTPFVYVDTVSQEADSLSLGGTVTFDASRGRFFDPESVPGIFALEALAQLSGILLLRLTGSSRGGLLVGLDDVELGELRPAPAEVHLYVRVVGLSSRLSRLLGTAHIDGRLWCRARLAIHHHHAIGRAAIEGVVQ
jgi:3-hydroxymyristoyl/3-hydroxydecanoyl-(acyl carrier protein) dehydratase